MVSILAAAGVIRPQTHPLKQSSVLKIPTWQCAFAAEMQAKDSGMLQAVQLLWQLWHAGGYYKCPDPDPWQLIMLLLTNASTVICILLCTGCCIILSILEQVLAAVIRNSSDSAVDWLLLLGAPGRAAALLEWQINLEETK
jgi:hypothetical protein